MATLKIDLDRVSDVEFALELLTRIVTRLRAAAPAVLADMPQPEALDNEIRDLLGTKTGQVLIGPFVAEFGDQPASFEKISEIIEVEVGVDRQRKVHSLFAGLGRWETPRKIKVFEPTNDRPPNYRMAPEVLAAIKRVQAEDEEQ